MKMSIKRLAVLPLVVGAIAPAFVAAQYTISSYVLGNGGTASSNSTYRMVSTLGQPAAGVTQNSAGGTHVGFWYQASPASTPALPPWQVTSNTPSNATIAIPASINPTLGLQPLQTGDAIGVFFDRSGSPICAGYGLWKTSENLSITAWGDDPQTPIKDGFAEGELIRFKIWEARAQKEYAATATYQTGGPNYTTNGIYVLSSLTGVTSVTQNLALGQGWNMISSFVEPADPALEQVFAAILSQVVIMKNGAGQVFWPGLNINQIGNWNIRDGYQIFLQSAAPLSIAGSQVVPETTPISLRQGWNLVAYLRNSAVSIETALAGIVNNLLIAKNGAGQVFWPALNINQIGAMVPGQGYQMYLLQAASLTYPANSASASSITLASPAIMNRVTAAKNTEPRPDAPAPRLSGLSSTGVNAVLLVESPGSAEGEEISAWTPGGRCIGRGAVRNGMALLTLWGDDALTEDIVDGARENEEIALTGLLENGEKTTLRIVSLRNALTGEHLAGPLHYQTDAVWIARLEPSQALPTAFSLEQNYPNPFNPSTLIRYALPYDADVKLEVFNALGRLIVVLVDAPQKAGYHEAHFAKPDLPSGLYFYRLQAGQFSAIRKMILMQ